MELTINLLQLKERGTVAEMKQFVSGRLNNTPELEEFCISLILGVRRNQTELDAQLAQIADNWSISRMAATDRNVMRLGAFEILYTDTPNRAAINEAVELAKRFGSAQSAQFVNGILDKFLHRKEPPAK